MNETIQEGMDVLLYLNGQRTYLVRVRAGQNFHTHKGFLCFDDLIGKRFGEKVRTNLGVAFTVLKPTMKDYILKMLRKTQIIYPKDMALIILYANIGPGSRVVEAGTGSGALASIIAYHVKPNGRVYSYEIREEFLEVAKKNLERAGIAEYVELKNKDITLNIDEEDVDAVVLDLAAPWLVVPHAYKALKGGGNFASFSPTIDQVVKTVEALEEYGFVDVEAIECIIRRFQVKRGQTRPETRMIGHTGYLVFARKTVISEQS